MEASSGGCRLAFEAEARISSFHHWWELKWMSLFAKVRQPDSKVIDAGCRKRRIAREAVGRTRGWAGPLEARLAGSGRLKASPVRPDVLRGSF